MTYTQIRRMITPLVWQHPSHACAGPVMGNKGYRIDVYNPDIEFPYVLYCNGLFIEKFLSFEEAVDAAENHYRDGVMKEHFPDIQPRARRPFTLEDAV